MIKKINFPEMILKSLEIISESVGLDVDSFIIMKLTQIANDKKRKPKTKLIGFRKGSLIIIQILKPKEREDGRLEPMVRYRCECGNERDVILSTILHGSTASCGCLGRETTRKRLTTHGLSHHPLFKLWGQIIDRCYNKAHHAYKDYGGRGILMCNEWKGNFRAFYDWATANNWRKGIQIERKNNNKGYSPENCTFATSKEQSRNRRSNVFLTHNNETLTLVEWAERFQIPVQTFYARYYRKVPIEKLFAPTNKIHIQLTIGRITRNLSQWARHYGVCAETVCYRYRNGVRGGRLFSKSYTHSKK